MPDDHLNVSMHSSTMRMQTNAVKHIILIDTVKGLPIYDSGSNNLLLTAEITHGDGDT
jgi:hypothetical protein